MERGAHTNNAGDPTTSSGCGVPDDRSGGEAGRSSFVVRRRVMVGRLFEVGEPRALLSTAPDGKGSTD